MPTRDASDNSRSYRALKRRLCGQIDAARVTRAEIRGYGTVVGETWDRKQNDRGW